MYESHFGLSGKPFGLNPDPTFFFGSKGHRRALAYLEYGVHQGEGFIVVTGEVGAGKTTLVRTLMNKLPRGAIAAAQIVSTQVDEDNLLRLVASAFGIVAVDESKAMLLHALEQHFLSLHSQGKRALLVVDEAQNLSQRAVEELRMLSNFQTGSTSLVQSFLVGQPEFRQIIESPHMRQLRQRVIASFHLGPLDPEEVRKYIEHRLTVAGWKNFPSIEAATYDRVNRFTGGIPRRINTLLDRALLSAFLNEQSEISADHIDEIGGDLLAETEACAIGETPPLPVTADPAMRSRPLPDAGASVAESLLRISEQLEAIHVTTRLIYRAFTELTASNRPTDLDKTSDR